MTDPQQPRPVIAEPAEELDDEPWDCGSGRCDPNTGCPECSDERRTWRKRS